MRGAKRQVFFLVPFFSLNVVSLAEQDRNKDWHMELIYLWVWYNPNYVQRSDQTGGINTDNICYELHTHTVCVFEKWFGDVHHRSLWQMI